ncbi:hypothetical protein [Acidipropionibacterium virtanenii]|uniref:DUF4064 domain-containing protein n=1 Tax=Acidipropionibacterium virtanenii TaxID=2057246 RepID=A0A344UUT1_9ACTN|nr:hypothetical protein [Acidipropionibacterium virtanenii]AXE39029.1 hypothetical protein JS278_01873 [Acidipropionibacterium virtanenii]
MSQDPNGWNPPSQDSWSPDGNAGWSGPGSTAGSAGGPYGSSPYDPNPYAAPYAAQSGGGDTWGISSPGSGSAEERSIKGIVAICLVGAALVVSFILSWVSGLAIVDLYNITGVTLSSEGDFPDTSATDSAYVHLGMAMLGQLIPTGLGIAAIIVGAMAIRFRNARALGISAIVLAVLAPFLSVSAMMLAAAPAL